MVLTGILLGIIVIPSAIGLWVAVSRSHASEKAQLLEASRKVRRVETAIIEVHNGNLTTKEDVEREKDLL